jgi:hypothetical protein
LKFFGRFSGHVEALLVKGSVLSFPALNESKDAGQWIEKSNGVVGWGWQ